MSDGAHLGVSASRALRTILGGEPSPTEDEGFTPAQMRAWLEEPHREIVYPDGPLGVQRTPEQEVAGAAGYEESARQAAKAMLAYLDAHPEHRELPLDDEIDLDRWRVRNYKGKPRVIRKGVYTLMKADGVSLEKLGLSGFQAGWAFNAARYALGEPPAPNPALLTIGERPA